MAIDFAGSLAGLRQQGQRSLDNLTESGRIYMDRGEQARRQSLADLRMKAENLALKDAERKAALGESLRSTLATPQYNTRSMPNPAMDRYLAAHTPEALDVAQGRTSEIVPNQSYQELGWNIADTPNPAFTQGQRQLEAANMAPPAATIEERTQKPFYQVIGEFAQQHPEYIDEATQSINLNQLMKSIAPDEVSRKRATEDIGTFAKGIASMKELIRMGVPKEQAVNLIRQTYPASIQSAIPDDIEFNESGNMVIPGVGQWIENPQTGEMIFQKSNDEQLALMMKRDELQSARDEKNRAAADARLEKSLAARGQTPQPGKVLPATQLESLSDAAQIIKTLEEAKGIASKVNTGPVAGRAQRLGQLVGMAGEDFNQFNQKLATANNIMLKLRSGAAVTESEYNRFLQEMPTANDDEKIRDTKLTNAINYARELLTNKTETFREGGYKVPEGTVERSRATQQTTGKGLPKPGDIEDGYRFKGGDRANPKNWVKVGK